jgi:glycerol-3-phosphate dehydrogenase
VIGGGILGATTAWDAAQRGLSVALVEAGDFGSGTSWNSLKTIHGGLRHLQKLDLAGLREGVRERRALLRIAPSVVAPLSFVVLTHGLGARSDLALRIAMGLYNALSRDRNEGVPEGKHLAPGRMLSREELQVLVPGLSGASGAALWQDAQLDRPDALLLGFVRAAADAGAVAANYVEATELRLEGGRVVGARIRDREAMRETDVAARMTVVATGHGLDPLLERSGLTATGIPWLSAINVVLRRDPPPVAVGGRAGTRNLFAVPWRDRTMIGTDYVPRGRVDAARVAAFVSDAQAAFPWLGVRAEDVALVHHGFVPGTAATKLWSRDAILGDRELRAPGVLALVASKYTTARATAERTVDRVLAELGRAAVSCRTASTTLPIPDDTGVPLEDRARRAVRQEMALHLADVIQRRTDVGAAGPPGEDTIERLTRVLTEELGWPAARITTERQALREAYRMGSVLEELWSAG